MIWQAITSIIPWEWIAGAVAGLVALAGVWLAGRWSGAVSRDLAASKATDAAHERITDAETDLGGVTTDAERVRRLADFARKHGA
jgi:hypothetical protein